MGQVGIEPEARQMDQIVSDLPRELPDNFGSTQTDFLGTNDTYLGVKNFQDQKTPEIPKKSPFVSPKIEPTTDGL